MLSGCHENPPSPANDKKLCSLLFPLCRSQLLPPSLGLHPQLAEDHSLVGMRAKNIIFSYFIHWYLTGDFSGERSFPASTLRTNPCSWSSLQREQALHPITARDGSGNPSFQMSLCHQTHLQSLASSVSVPCSLCGN